VTGFFVAVFVRSSTKAIASSLPPSPISVVAEDIVLPQQNPKKRPLEKQQAPSSISHDKKTKPTTTKGGGGNANATTSAPEKKKKKKKKLNPKG